MLWWLSLYLKVLRFKVVGIFWLMLLGLFGIVYIYVNWKFFIFLSFMCECVVRVGFGMDFEFFFIN